MFMLSFVENMSYCYGSFKTRDAKKKRIIHRPPELDFIMLKVVIVSV